MKSYSFLSAITAFTVGLATAAYDAISTAFESILNFFGSIQLTGAHSIELDTVAHQTRMVDTGDGSHASRVMAFRKRAAEHDRFSAGGFALDDSLSAA